MMYKKPEFKIERFDIEEKIMADDVTSTPETNPDDSNLDIGGGFGYEIISNVFNL